MSVIRSLLLTVSGEQVLLKSLTPLAEQVLGTWLAQLPGVDRLILSPDAMLWLVPWSALPLSDQKYAVEQFQIDYVVSGRDLLLSTNLTNKQSPAILFSDPDYDLDAKQVLNAVKELFPANQVPRLTNLVRPEATLSKVPRLPATAIEAAAIAPKLQTLTAQEPQRFADQYAQETALKAIQRPSVLVISTHGFFLADHQSREGNLTADDVATASMSSRAQRRENPLLRCGLLLAGCNAGDLAQRIDADDGVLTGQEILDIDLRGTGLVVLSACQTGVGEVNNGEGVAGLRQAFQLAGARVVMATLWEVPDVQTARLMIKFFDNFSSNHSVGSALRIAQQETINARRERQGAAHPFFWAAFTLTGQN